MRTVTVTGRGTAREVPDTVVVRVASSHRATGVAEALAGADSAATEIIAVGREHTEASRIGSTNLNVWPAYDNEGKPSGFEARHSLSITCTDIASAGDLLAALATKVGDRLQVEGFDLTVSDTARALDSARSGAREVSLTSRPNPSTWRRSPTFVANAARRSPADAMSVQVMLSECRASKPLGFPSLS